MKRATLHTLYASGNLGKSTASSLLEFFALFYFTDVLGISPALAGSIILLSLVWDGIADPLVGIIADRLRLHFDSIAPFFSVGIPITAGSLVGLFLVGEYGGEYKTAFVTLWLLVFRTAYTIIDIPHNGMLAFITRDPRQRTNIASLRIFFSALGRLVITAASIYVLANTTDASAASRFTIVAAGAAGVFLVAMLVCMAAMTNIPMVRGSELTGHFNLRGIVKTIVPNRHLCVVFGLTAVTSLTTHVFGSAFVYYSKYGLGDGSAGGTALTILAIAQAISLVFWSRLSNRLASKGIAAQWANGVLFVAMLLAISLLNSTATLYGIAALTGFSIGGIYMLNWSMLPDALDFGAPVEGRRYDLTVFSLYSLTSKVLTGVSHAYVGWVLTAFNYSGTAEIGTVRIGEITQVIFCAPLIGALICILLARGFTIEQTAQSNG